ncbi:MAG: hypothetical protein HUJ28_04490 [Chromatiales bacterium]|nr:hypothetical protein [Chromatiales bacterium]
MPAWLVPALKAVLPHVGSIVAAAAPVFTQKRAGEASAGQAAVVQQQIAELQQAASQNAVHVRELAEQLGQTVTALERAAEQAEARMRRAVGLSLVAVGLAGVALLLALVVLLRG